MDSPVTALPVEAVGPALPVGESSALPVGESSALPVGEASNSGSVIDPNFFRNVAVTPAPAQKQTSSPQAGN